MNDLNDLNDYAIKPKNYVNPYSRQAQKESIRAMQMLSIALIATLIIGVFILGMVVLFSS